MNTQTSYVNKKAQQTLLAILLTILVSVFIPQIAFAQTYSGPIVITKGGTYKGNWESRNSEVAAVNVKTSEPVIIENSNVRGAGALIRSVGHNANITIRNTNGYGLTPTPWSNYKKPRRFLSLDQFKNAVIENCYMENTAGIYVGGRYTGDNSTANTVKIRYNKAKNIDGRIYGGKDLVQFVQFNFKGAIRNVEVAWNQVINEPNNSAVEDNINIFNTQGTSDSPLRIHNNYIQGAYPIPANSSKYTGGGIISDTNADLATATKHIKAYENHLVNMGNYSMGIAGGNNIRYHNNRAVNSARFKDGSKFNMFTSGLWSNDYYKKGTTFSNKIDHNEVGITSWGNPGDRKDFNPNNPFATYLNNVNLPGPITLQAEADEYTRWKQKLSRNGIVLGPNGSSGGSTPPTASTTPPATTPPAAAPAPTPTTPTTGNTGMVTLEFWAKVTGNALSAVPVTTAPSKAYGIALFEAPSNQGGNYGQRIRGFVIAPVTGQYTFWIAGDDMAELYLSTSEDPAKKVKIAATSKWTNSREWTKQASQQSSKITLQAGKRYYIEALHLQTTGGDNLAVGWQLPNGTMERPIAGKRLSQLGTKSPAGSTPTAASTPTANKAPSVSLTAPTANAVFEVGKAIALTSNSSDADGKVVKVEYFHGTTKIGESTASPFSYNWTNATAGSYSITAKATDNLGATKTTAPVNITIKATTTAATATKTTSVEATVYPSTFRDVVTLDLGNQSVTLSKVDIADYTGRTIYSVAKPSLSNNKLEIDLTGVRMISGMYYINYTDSTGKSHSIKIFKG